MYSTSDSAPETHYKSPSTISPLGIVLGGLAVLAGGLILAPIYSYAIVYIPFVYINLILTGLFGLCAGLMIAGGLRVGHTHNKAVSYGLVGIGLLFAYWMHWAWWFSGLAFSADFEDFSVISMLLPGNLIESVGSVYEVGTWGIGSSGDAVSGIFLGIIWLSEALLFFGTGLFGGAMLIGSGTYCSRCKAWCTEMPATRLQADPTGDLAQQVDRQNWAVLLRPAPTDGSSMWHEAHIHRCEGCGETNTVTLKDITVSHDKKGNEQRNDKVVVDRVYITGADLNTLLNS